MSKKGSECFSSADYADERRFPGLGIVGFCRIFYVSAWLLMILLEIPFFRHYVFAVVQTSPSPTQPGGEPPLPRARRKRERQDAMDMVDVVDMVDKTWTFLTFSCPLSFSRKRLKAPSQPGRLRYFLKRMPSHPSEQQPYINFRAFPWFKTFLDAL